LLATVSFPAIVCARPLISPPLLLLFCIQIMYIAMFGCEGYPAGYPFLNRGGSASCEDSIASGWLGAFLLLFIIIFGAYVLPTVLIGIVAISFEEATQRSNNMQVRVDCPISINAATLRMKYNQSE